MAEDIIQQQILQAAQQLFQKHGYQKVTMDDVAKAIGKGRSSLYYYYKNKDEVFDAVVGAEIDDIVAEITRMVDKADTVADKLRAFAITKTKIGRKRRIFFDMLETGMNADELSQYTQRKKVIQKKIRIDELTLLNRVLDGYNAADKAVVIFVFTSSLRGLKREMDLENSYARMEPAIDVLVRMTMLAIQG
ncbi:helix-turn-helix domain-containing protein [Chitinophaga sancti]|uniref:TetR/AcrR family transcriptional regulator n=1 Tax=Chitinophaga sancti TaxID=1004 RepID=UPI002A75720B|nr:helix-turn-helix domain-containing protein [Chitinophaga sancti]WPQ61636.1 helix-turn-helix domain-containing protein [Chitinophaga sancti]